MLELLLEVASEIVVHKRKHTSVRFPPLEDTELGAFLDTFLESFGGYTAERPTAKNLFELSKCVLLSLWGVWRPGGAVSEGSGGCAGRRGGS